MADKLILVDTSVLIDFFRKTDKINTLLVALVEKGYDYCISAITEYEIYRGVVIEQVPFWDSLLEKIEVLAFDKATARIAVNLNADLKRKRKQIAVPDLFIAATAIAHNLPLATLNKKHFERIDALLLIS